MSYHVPPENQGQRIEVSYRWDEDGTGVLRRAYNRSDRATAYAYARLDDDEIAALSDWYPWQSAPDIPESEYAPITEARARQLAGEPTARDIAREVNRVLSETGSKQRASRAHASILQEERRPYAVSPRLAHARILKSPAVMTAGEINKELDKLEEQNSKLTQKMIDAGRGYERPSEYLRLDDPLSAALRDNSNRRQALRIEISSRYGPEAPRRLPKGFGPIKYHARIIRQKSKRRAGRPR